MTVGHNITIDINIDSGVKQRQKKAATVSGNNQGILLLIVRIVKNKSM